MMRAIILINAYSGPEHSLYQSGRLKEELEKRGVAADIRRNNFFAALLGDGGEVLSRLSGYDFCIYLDKDKYISRLLEKTGMRLFNPHAAVEACDDKMTTAICLSDAGIPMPKTLPGLLCYDPSERIADETLDTVAAELGFPLIVKTSYGSLGKGVAKAEDREALRTLAEQVKCMPHLFQRCISSSYGRDIRAIVIGGKYVAAMERRSFHDFRSNLEMGGVGSPFDAPEEVRAMCEKAARLLRLDYCGVDVLFGERGYYLCEVNSNAFFRGFEEVTGINVARLYTEHILSVMEERT